MFTEDEFILAARKCPCLRMDSGMPSAYKKLLKERGGAQAITHIVIKNNLNVKTNVVVALSEPLTAPFYFLRKPTVEERIKAAKAIKALFGEGCKINPVKLAAEIRKLFDSSKSAMLSVDKAGNTWLRAD